jgi:peptide/nickel transport system permease protein
VTRYFARRLLYCLTILLALTLVSFVIVRLIPGDPVAVFAQVNHPDPAALAVIRHQLALDQPWWRQYLRWIQRVAVGDFGASITRPQQVGEQLAARLPVSLELSIMAVLLAVGAGIPLGVLAAVRRNGWIDGIVRGLGFVSLAVPAFIIATFVILANSNLVEWRLFGYIPFADDPFGSIVSMLIPAGILALAMGAVIARFTRATLIDELAKDYVRTARAKGALEPRIVVVHALRNALIPVSSVVGVQLASVIGGTVIIESMFALPGMGTYLIQSITTVDYPAIQACVLVFGVVFVVINLAVDALHPLLDPRIGANG